MSEPSSWPTVITDWLDRHPGVEVNTNAVARALPVPLETLEPQDFAYIYRCIRAAGWRRKAAGKWKLAVS